ncbi:isopentenyl phosphate kinase [Methanobacterium aggregans]|uniref:isopentenyl phosphate kinase n=1 Tax=Methanobacterium aggregans TaxID=1615586 RepID=UPI001AE8B804|nr:isopentenyl phosphate kinase [Methanobacterium aggregans]MBP2044940.1 isopentenyl phosphate kinase [Methanobacterium aggregans]
MIILKLGGSVITRKDSATPALDNENLNRIAKEISESSKNAKYGELIVVHGAGSFGHPYAKKYDIGSSIPDEEEFQRKRKGFCITQEAVKNLNSAVCQHLRQYGIPAVSVQPSSFVRTKNKRICHADLDLIKKYLDSGFVPVLYGDVVLDDDEAIKMAVLSGDQIINYLGKNLKPDRVILGSDVNGIYRKDPKKYSNEEPVKIVTSHEDLESTEGTQTVDVTGGMGGKLTELLQLAEIGVESEILNAGSPNLIKRALMGERGIGTRIKL